MNVNRPLVATFAGALSLAVISAPTLAKDHWVASWGAAQTRIAGETVPASGMTYRNIVHLSLGGKQVRLTLSNRFGTEPLTIGGVSVARSDSGSTLKSRSLRAVTFGGKSGVVIAPGAIVISDPAPIDVAPLGDLAVSIFLPAQKLTFLTGHAISRETNYVADGDRLDAASLSATTTPWRILAAVDVKAPEQDAAIVAFGDSITDGMGNTVDANLRWPDQLAARLQADPKYAHLAVVNEGISGNRILQPGGDLVTHGQHHSALFRWSYDALNRSGVKYVVLLEGINDIGISSLTREGSKKFHGEPITAEDLIRGMTQLIGRAHTKGIKVIGATLTPYEGAQYERPDGEKIRDQVNEFIRHGGKFDGVIDFEKATQDPADPDKLRSGFNNGDHIHPNDAGAKAMADSIDLKVFE